MVKRLKLDDAPEAKIYLAEWRETKFKTQQALADKMGTTGAAISRIEKGAREWSKGYLEALAFLVGCQVGDLFRKPDEVLPQDQPEPEPEQAKPELEQLMVMAASLSRKQIEALIAVVEQYTPAELPQAQAAEHLPAPPAKAKSV